MIRISRAFHLALEGISQNRIRSLLTALGIIFGVAAVISMLAIGNGAQRAILEQLEMIGTNNIVINAVFDPEDESSDAGGSQKRPYTPGLQHADIDAIRDNLPHVEAVAGQIKMRHDVIYQSVQVKAPVFGVNRDYFDIYQLQLSDGRTFLHPDNKAAHKHCIIGPKLATQLFKGKSPIGKKIKLGVQWFTVIGLIQPRDIGESTEELGLNPTNDAVFIPLKTALLSFENRSRITEEDFRGRDEASPKNYHQLDQITVKVTASRMLGAMSKVIAKLLRRRHNEVEDYEIQIPELLIEQQQQTQSTFNWVLGAIAAISLLVGGIGIMNIMLASVLERIKEIGIRRSLGATERDVIMQFLLEAMMISIIGGIIGIILGVAVAVMISSYAEIPTVISPWSILLSFGVSSVVGLLFGWYPAQSAAKEDPITALRKD